MSHEPIQIRRASAGDAALLAPLLEAFNGPPMSPHRAAARLNACGNVETTFLALHGDVAVGFACLRLIPSMAADVPYAELTELYVAEANRRQGIGRRLIEWVTAEARERGADELLVLVGFNNPEGKSFYHATGFGEHALTMRKRVG